MASNLTVDTIRNSSGDAILMENGVRKYSPGQVVQQFYYRYDGVESFTTSTSWSARVSDADFGRAVHVTPFNTSITPMFANSLIVWELQIFGEPTAHNSGFLIGERNTSLDQNQVINRSGYEGYNNTRTIDQQNTFVSDFYDADNDSTCRLTRIMYFDAPGSTELKTYIIFFTSTVDNTNYTYRINRTAGATAMQTSGFEVGVSTWCIKEIAQ